MDTTVQGSALPFADATQQEDEAVVWAVERNILRGTAQGTLALEGGVTRAQAAVLLARMLKG